MKKRIMLRILSCVLSLSMVLSELPAPLYASAAEEEEVVEDVQDVVEDETQDETISETANLAKDISWYNAPPAAWTNNVSSYTDNDNHVIYDIYKVGSEYKLLVYPALDGGLPYKNICIEDWEYIRENVEEVEPYVNSITEIIFRGCKEIYTYFTEMPSLKKIYFDDVNNPTSIDDCSIIHWGAFENNPNLEEVYLPVNLEKIPGECFHNCSKLKKIAYYDETNVPYFSSSPLSRFAGTPRLKEVGYEACSPYMSTAMESWGRYESSLEEFPFVSSIEVIDTNAFNGCTKITGELDFSSNRKIQIEQGAFQDCTGITGVKLTDFYTNDLPYASSSEVCGSFCGSMAFEGCTNLTTFNFGDAFGGHGYSNNINYQIGNHLFSNCSKLKYLYWMDSNVKTAGIPRSVKVIGGGAFYNCDAITQARFEQIADDNYVNEIKYSAFSGCDGITSVNFDNKIGDNAFENCSNLTSVYVEGPIGKDAFKNTPSNYKPVESVTLNKNEVILDSGAEETLSFTLTPTDATLKTATWSSSDEAVATVNKNGKITAVAPGTATITVTTNDSAKTATCTVTVPVRVTGVTISPKTLEINAGSTGSVTSVVAPENATIKNVAYSSSDTEVATVAEDGTITGIKAGTAVITVTTEDGNFTDTCLLTVKSIPVTGITVSPETLNLNKNSTGKITYVISPETASNKGVNITSTNPSVATVDASGNISAISTGSTVIIVTTKDGGFMGTCNVTVSEGSGTVNVTGVTISPKTLSLVAGTTGTVSAEVSPAGATNKAVTYSSSNTDIATVAANGTVTAVAPGSATITVTTTDGNFTDTCSVTVTAASVAVSGVTIDPETMSLTVGSTGNVTATVLPEAATNKNVSYRSSDESVVTVTNTGVITAVAKGHASVTVTTADGNKTATCVVTVIEANEVIAVTGVTANPKTMNLKINEYKKLSAVIAPENATDKAVTYSSNKTDVATVTADGTVTGLKAGTAVITITTVDGSFTDTCAVTVSNDYFIRVTGVRFNKNTINLKLNGYTNITATIQPDNATNKAISYSSSDPSIVYIDNAGTVTGKAIGKATVTVTTVEGGFTDSCEVTVSNTGSISDNDPDDPEDPDDDKKDDTDETDDENTPTPKPTPAPEEQYPVLNNAYTVIFYEDTIVLHSEVVAKGGLVLNPPVVEREGSTFIGWYDKDAGGYWSPVMPVNRNMSVYARFKDNETGEIEEDGIDDNVLESYDNIATLKTSSEIYLVKGQRILVAGCSVASSNPDVLSVYNGNGNQTIYARENGTVEISVSLATGETVKHKAFICTPELSSKALKLKAGESSPIKLTLSAGEDKYKVFYSSSNPDVAHVYDGKVYALSKGSATVYAHVNGKKYGCKVTVLDPPSTIKNVNDITMFPLQVSTLKYSDGFNAKKANWTIETVSGNNVVSIRKNKLTATGTGIAILTGTDNRGNIKVLTVTVKEPTSQTIHMNVGKSKNIKFYKLPNKKAVWSVSGNSSVATVSRGKVKAITAGVTEIVATYQGFTFITYVVAENPSLVPDAKLVQSGKKFSLNLLANESYNLKLTGTNQQVIFTSNKPEIVRVSQNGQVIPCGTGKAKITAKVNGKTFKINVNIM